LKSALKEGDTVAITLTTELGLKVNVSAVVKK
jgi:copper(I)-binding protein